jgi:hypothetical protein
VIAPAALVLIAAAYFMFRPATPTATEISLHPTPTDISLTAQAGSASSPSADVDLGDFNVPFRARASAPWVTVKPDSGNHIGSLHIQVDPSGLKPSSYNATIEIAPADPEKYKVANGSIPVRLTVTAEPVKLRVQPASLEFEYRDGGTAPAPKTISIEPNQPGSIQTRWATKENWVRVQPAAGGLSVVVKPLPRMKVGSHTATLLIELPGAANNPQRVTVSLKVSSAFGGIKIQ